MSWITFQTWHCLRFIRARSTEILPINLGKVVTGTGRFRHGPRFDSLRTFLRLFDRLSDFEGRDRPEEAFVLDKEVITGSDPGNIVHVGGGSLGGRIDFPEVIIGEGASRSRL